MKKCLSFLLIAGFVVAMGCAKEPDPRDRPDFVDTASDPAKVMETMKPAPGQPGGKGGAGGGGAAGAGAGAGPAPGAGS